MSERPTPETDAVAEKINFGVDIDFARKLERERDEAREKAERYRLEANAMMMQRDEAREHLEDVKEYGTEEINASVDLRQKLAHALVERDKAMEALMKIEDLFIDGADIYADREKMGMIAKKALEETK